MLAKALFNVVKRVLIGLSFIAVTTLAYAENKPILIRPFGDSITFGIGFNNVCQPVVGVNNGQVLCWPPASSGGGYRGFMSLFAVEGNGMVFTTEGYRSDGSYLLQWNTNTQTHDGYPGYTNTQLAPIALLPSFADYTLVHSGTNDILQSVKPADAASYLNTVLSNLLQRNTTVNVLVAKIIPVGPKWAPYYQANIDQYNELIPEVVATLLVAYPKRIELIDMSTVLNIYTDFDPDDIHPNSNGYMKMARHWISKIKTLEKASVGN